MSTEDTTTATTTTETTGQAPATETVTPDPAKGEGTTDWWQKEISRVRSEAAKSRVEKRELEAKLANAKTPEEFEAVKAEAAASAEKATKLERELLVERLGKGLPDDMVKTLNEFQGDEKALKSLADTMRKYAPDAGESGSGSLGGGLDPSSLGDDFDPKAVAKEMRSRRY